MNRSRRLVPAVAALAVSSVAGFSSLTTGSSAGAQSVVPAASTDYAVEAFGDPWDWSNSEDGGPAKDLLSAGIDSSRIENGELKFTVGGPSFWFFAQGGYADSTPTGRDVNLHPIDASRYNRMVLRITSSKPLSAGLLWFGCTEGDSCVG